MHSVSPSRSSIPENDGPVTVEDFRAPSFSHVIDNAIASAAMRELLEMMVTSHDSQLWISCFRTLDAYTCCMRGYVSKVSPLKWSRHFHSGSTNCVLTDSFPAPEWAPYWLQRIDLILSEVCIDFCPNSAQWYSRHTIFMPTGTKAKGKINREIMMLRLMA